jgi:hypothetical protein
MYVYSDCKLIPEFVNVFPVANVWVYQELLSGNMFSRKGKAYTIFGRGTGESGV